MNKIFSGKTWLLVIFLFAFQEFQAANLYWYGHNSTVFAVAANWSTSNTGYVAAGSWPGGSDIANFGNYTGVTTQNCSPAASVSVQGMNFVAGYTGTFTQGSNTITIGSSGGTFSAGTFTGSASSAITSSGAITISGTSFTSTGGTFSCSANFTVSSGSFTHNNGILQLTATSTLTVSNTGGTTFYSLDFSPSASATFTITSTTTINVANLLTYSGSGTITLNSGTINVQGAVTVTNTGTSGGGSGTIKLTSTTQTITGPTSVGQGILPNLTFSSNSTSTYTISGTTLTVAGTLSIAGTGALTFSTGTINLSGNISITNSGAGGGSATLNINGTGAQTFTGGGATTTGLTPNINIDKLFTSGTLTLSNTIACGGNWTYVKGNVDASTNTTTVAMNGNKNLDGQGTDSTMKFYKVSIASGTTTLTGNLIAANTVTLTSGSTLLGNGFNINVGTKWNNQGATWTPGSGTVTFYGSNYGFIQKSGTESFTNLAINKTSTGTKLSCPVDVTGTFTLTSGRLTTTSTNYLNITSTGSVSGGSNTAYVNGPMRKTGNTSFTFPLGDSVVSTPYHPLGITAPASSTDSYMAQYKGTGQTSGSSLASTLASVSNCEYWTLQRTAPASGTTTITPTLNWNTVCANVNYSEMAIAAWNGSQWVDDGAGTLNAANPGSLAASTALSFTNATTVVPVLIAKKLIVQSYAKLEQDPNGGYYNTNGNVLYFRYEEEYKDANGYISYQVINPATNAAVTLLSNSSTTNVPVVYGTNSYKMDLYTAANTPLASGKYILVVTNDKNETFQLMFNKN